MDELVPVDALDEIAHHIDGTFVVVVEKPGDKYRRRCYLTVAAAQHAARNALADGLNAKVYLAELRVVWRLEGGSS